MIFKFRKLPNVILFPPSVLSSLPFTHNGPLGNDSIGCVLSVITFKAVGKELSKPNKTLLPERVNA